MITIRFSERTPTPGSVQVGMEEDRSIEKLRFLLPQIADDQTAVMHMILPDGTADTLTILDGIVQIPDEDTAQAGWTRAWVEILGGETLAWHSEIFYLDVGELPPISEDIERQYPNALQTAILTTTANKTAAQAAQAAAETAQTGAVNAKTAAESARDTAVSITTDIQATVDTALAAAKASGEFDGPPGQDGQDGQDGQNGQDGVSPTVAVSSITGGHRVTVTDGSGDHAFDVLDGSDGQDGQDGAPGVGIPSGGTDGQMIVKDGSTDYATKWANQPSVPVQDVQVNGTSILNNGVANVPVASASNLGLVKTAGTGIFVNSTGEMSTVKATSAQIKAATANFAPIVPNNQHESTFYGLAKAAGDTTQSASGNPVGTYTDAAKSAIQTMLGISAIIGPVTDVQMNGTSILSGGVANISTDASPTESSDNPVKSGGVYTALSGKKNTQTAVSDPTASGNSLSFIDSISQDTQGVITATKKSVTVDASPTENSLNPVQSGGVKTSLDGKVDKAGDTMTGILVAPDLRVNAAENTDAELRLYINSASKCTVQYSNQNQQLRLMEWKSSGGDVYSLPSISGEPTGNRYYDILTSKTFTPASIGIVEDTDTATHTISKGQYVIWKGALYTAKSAIPSGTALSSSNLQAVSNGGLNAVNDRIGIKDVTYTVASTSVGAKSQSYAYVAMQSGYTPISAYFVPDSGSSIIIILSNPVVSSSKAVCRIFNPNDAAVTIAGTLHVLFAKNAMIES